VFFAFVTHFKVCGFEVFSEQQLLVLNDPTKVAASEGLYTCAVSALIQFWVRFWTHTFLLFFWWVSHMSSQVVDFNNTESGSTHVDDYWVQIQVCCHTDLTDLTSLGIRAMFGDQCKIDLLLSSLLVSLNMQKCSMKTYLRVRERQRGRGRERDR